MLLRVSGRVDAQVHQPLNAAIIQLALPAVTLRTLHGLRFDGGHLLPVRMPWLLFALGLDCKLVLAPHGWCCCDGRSMPTRR